MRTPLLCLLACALPTAAVLAGAETIRHDLTLAVEAADPAFDYHLATPLGSYDGSDAFERDRSLRLGLRWAFAGPGWSVAPLVGGDLLVREAPMAGSGLRAWGGGASAGLTWACLDAISLDAEGWGAWTRTELSLDTPDGGCLSGSGDGLAWGGRMRLLWTPVRRWSLGAELGWRTESITIAGDGERELTLEAAGWTAGLVLAWRPTARPQGLE